MLQNSLNKLKNTGKWQCELHLFLNKWGETVRHSPEDETGAAAVGHSDLPAARKGLVDSPQQTHLQFRCSIHNQDAPSPSQ